MTIAPIAFAGMSFLAADVGAASYGLTANDASGSSSFTTGFNPAFKLNSTSTNPSTALTAGNAYQTNAFILRGPANGNAYTFAGDSLTISSGGAFC